MKDFPAYAFGRDSRIMCYVPASENLGGGHLFTPIEVSMDAVSDEYFEKIKTLVHVIQARHFDRARIADLLSGDFRWYVEIGDKETLAPNLTTIFASKAFEVIPSELYQLQKTLMNAIRDADGRPTAPEPTHNDIGFA